METSEFNAVMTGIDYPMFLVTATDGDRRAGCLVGFTTQTSIRPPRMLVCLSVKNRTYRVARDADLLAVHVVEPDDDQIAELFGGETGDDVDKFAQVAWTEGPGGVPLVAACPRRFVGRVLDSYDLGDHTGFLLDPVAAEGDDDGPAMGIKQASDVDAGHPA